MKELVWAIRYPILVAVANALVGEHLWALFGLGKWVATAIRMCPVAWAGWLLARNMESGPLEAIIVSAYVPIVDQVLFQFGKAMILLHFSGSEEFLASFPELEGERSIPLVVFSALGVSYFVYLPVVALFGGIGWALGRRPPTVDQDDNRNAPSGRYGGS